MTIRIKLYSVLIALQLIGIYGCNQAGEPMQNSIQIMPLALGNEWIGKVSDYGAQGNLASTRIDTLRIYKTEVFNGETWYYMNVFNLSGDTSPSVFANRPDGLYQCDSGKYDQAIRFAKYPAQPGDICVTIDNTFDSNGNGETDGISVDTTSYRVIVPSGTFNCYVYRGFSFSKDDDVESSIVEPGEYYAPGIGPVQFGYFNSDGIHSKFGPDRTWQLVRAILH